MTQQPVINTFILRVPTPRAQTPTPIHNNQPPPIPMNTKPNRRKGRSELYEDQFGNACNTDICLLEQIGSSKQCKLHQISKSITGALSSMQETGSI